MDRKERFTGCLLGGAIGDALGYPVEFEKEKDIFAQYGKRGITDLTFIRGKALISDDTQMTLFTAEGLLAAKNGDYLSSVAESYRDWYVTQTERFSETRPGHGKLIRESELFVRRAPGITCLSAIRSFDDGYGTVAKPINNSKGCGGVMRAAPVGLLSVASDDESDRLGAGIAALTHGHELGWIPSAAFAHMIRKIVFDNMTIREAAESSVTAMKKLFPKAHHASEFTAIMENALRLADSNNEDLNAIHELGEGWVAEEALAIAVFCAVRYADDFEKGLVVSVNHNGDSDSTGAIAGNILGAALGEQALPEKYLANLQLRDVIKQTAVEMYERSNRG